jgi:hypothetical protein
VCTLALGPRDDREPCFDSAGNRFRTSAAKTLGFGKESMAVEIHELIRRELEGLIRRESWTDEMSPSNSLLISSHPSNSLSPDPILGVRSDFMHGVLHDFKFRRRLMP